MKSIISLNFMTKPTIFHCQKAGLLTTVQDGGRIGFQAFGVPVAGVMDSVSAKIANELVGNLSDAPILEITLFGPALKIEGAAIIALSGADLTARINGNRLPLYESILLKDGDIISFGKPKNGCRAYLAIAGDWQVEKWLNSASAASQNVETLTPDSILKKGSQLKIQPNLSFSKKIYPRELGPKFPDLIRVRVMPGPEFSLFSKTIIDHFFGKIHHISSQYNRMGIRLVEKLLDFQPTQELISSGLVIGTIQVTNSGQPIILMRDAQTTGGYWRIGNVISEDLNKLAQVTAGDGIWLSLV
ncbi:MAG: antagonist of KipI [Saprospiraceae bacterium]|jgi:antagonist of KipI